MEKPSCIKMPLTELLVELDMTLFAKTCPVIQLKSKLGKGRPPVNMVRVHAPASPCTFRTSVVGVRYDGLTPCYGLRPPSFSLSVPRLLTLKIAVLLSAKFSLAKSRAYAAPAIRLIKHLSAAHRTIKFYSSVTVIAGRSAEMPLPILFNLFRSALESEIPCSGSTLPEMGGAKSWNTEAIHKRANCSPVAAEYLRDYFRTYLVNAIELLERGFAWCDPMQEAMRP